MAGRPDARLDRASVGDGGDPPPGSNGRSAAPRSACPASGGSRDIGGHHGGALRSIGCTGPSSRRRAHRSGAAEPPIGPGRSPQPGCRPQAGAEPSSLDSTGPRRGRPADRGPGGTGSLRAARPDFGAAHLVRGGRAARWLPRERRASARERGEAGTVERDGGSRSTRQIAAECFVPGSAVAAPPSHCHPGPRP